MQIIIAFPDINPVWIVSGSGAMLLKSLTMVHNSLQNNNNSVKQRLTEYLHEKNISKSEFGRSIGVSSAFISSMRKSIQSDKVQKIALRYPDLNIDWLLYGKGSMFINQSETKEKSTDRDQNLIPIYDIDFCCGDMRRETNEEHIIGGLSLPNIRKDAVIITATGDSMSPTINNGDRIILHQVNSWTYFNYGAVYGIVTEEYRLIKRVRKHPSDKNFILLRSENAEYDDIELPIADIRQLFFVDGVFKINML
ncbi:hypothetical protein MASR1M31_16470 [Porphyromonadaceae bacterium]